MVDFEEAFSGTEQVVSIITVPWYLREVALP
jgi:hypothetical protein